MKMNNDSNKLTSHKWNKNTHNINKDQIESVTRLLMQTQNISPQDTNDKGQDAWKMPP